MTRECKVSYRATPRRRSPWASAFESVRRLAATLRTPVHRRPFAAAHKRGVVKRPPVAGAPSNAWNVNFNNGNTNNDDVTNTNRVRCVR